MDEGGGDLGPLPRRLRTAAAQARLTPHNAVTEIDRLILTAWREKLPVYMELPSDIAYLDIEVPAAPLMLAQPASDPERMLSCAAAIAGHLSDARSPAILVDQDADRYGAAAEVMALAEKMQLPVAVTGPAKAVIDETFPYYAGIYNGKVSEPYTPPGAPGRGSGGDGRSCRRLGQADPACVLASHPGLRPGRR